MENAEGQLDPSALHNSIQYKIKYHNIWGRLSGDRFREPESSLAMFPGNEAVTGILWRFSCGDGSVERRLNITHANHRRLKREKSTSAIELWLFGLHVEINRLIFQVARTNMFPPRPMNRALCLFSTIQSCIFDSSLNIEPTRYFVCYRKINNFIWNERIGGEQNLNYYGVCTNAFVVLRSSYDSIQ